jgi:hypothetical protein
MPNSQSGGQQIERVPAVFDDRVIFGYPDPHQAAAAPARSGSGNAVVAAVAIMLVPCAVLGWLVWSQSKDLRGLKTDLAKSGVERVAKLETENETLKQLVKTRDGSIATLTAQVARYETSQEIFRSVAEQLNERERLVSAILPKLPSDASAPGSKWSALKDRPDWDNAAVDILTKHNAALAAYEKELQAKLDSTPARQSTQVRQGTIEPGRTD